MHVAVTVKQRFLPLPCIVIKGEVAQYSLPLRSPWEPYNLLSFSRNSSRVLRPSKCQCRVNSACPVPNLSLLTPHHLSLTSVLILSYLLLGLESGLLCAV